MILIQHPHMVTRVAEHGRGRGMTISMIEVVIGDDLAYNHSDDHIEVAPVSDTSVQWR